MIYWFFKKVNELINIRFSLRDLGYKEEILMFFDKGWRFERFISV